MLTLFFFPQTINIVNINSKLIIDFTVGFSIVTLQEIFKHVYEQIRSSNWKKFSLKFSGYWPSAQLHTSPMSKKEHSEKSSTNLIFFNIPGFSLIFLNIMWLTSPLRVQAHNWLSRRAFLSFKKFHTSMTMVRIPVFCYRDEHCPLGL